MAKSPAVAFFGVAVFIFLEKKGENVVDRKKMRNFTAEKDPQGFFLNTISYYLLFTYLFL